jgi:hypothetical protein
MTLSALWQFIRGLAVAMLVPLLGMPPSLRAQNHVVSPGDFERAAVAASADRRPIWKLLPAFYLRLEWRRP